MYVFRKIFILCAVLLVSGCYEEMKPLSRCDCVPSYYESINTPMVFSVLDASSADDLECRIRNEVKGVFRSYDGSPFVECVLIDIDLWRKRFARKKSNTISNDSKCVPFWIVYRDE